MAGELEAGAIEQAQLDLPSRGAAGRDRQVERTSGLVRALQRQLAVATVEQKPRAALDGAVVHPRTCHCRHGALGSLQCDGALRRRWHELDGVEALSEAIAKSGRSAVINIWVDPREYAPGTKNQTMYK